MSSTSKRSNTFLWMLLILILVIIVAAVKNTSTITFDLPGSKHLNIAWPWLITCLAFIGFVLGWLSRIGALRKKSLVIKDKDRIIEGMEKKMEGVMASMAAIGAQARVQNTEVIERTETTFLEDVKDDSENSNS